MVKREVQAMVVIFVVLGMGLVYAIYQVSDLQKQVDELRQTKDALGDVLLDINDQVSELITQTGGLKGMLWAETVTPEFENQVSKIENTVNTISESLHVPELIFEAGITIDNGTEVSEHSTLVVIGTTALDALRKVATVETTTHPVYGEYIDRINGVGSEPGTYGAAGEYWAFYYWGENDWKYSEVGAETYRLKQVDNIKFVWTSW